MELSVEEYGPNECRGSGPRTRCGAAEGWGLVGKVDAGACGKARGLVGEGEAGGRALEVRGRNPDVVPGLVILLQAVG
jgi:hypothetical protein